MVVQDVVSSHIAFKNVVWMFHFIHLEEVVHGDWLSAEWSKEDGAIWAEKSCLMQEVGQKTSKPVQLVFEAFAGTIFTVKTCLFLEKYMRFFGCIKDVDCTQKSMTSFVEVQCSQLLSKRSNFTTNEQLEESMTVHMTAMGRGNLRESLDTCGSPPGPPCIRTFQDHVLSYMCVLHQDYSIVDLACHVP